MAKKPPRRNSKPGAPAPADQPAPASPSSTVSASKLVGSDAWELVHPRCATDRAEDLEEVRTMIEAGELDVARDECRWLLDGCSECLEAHRMLGEIALEEEDLALARGHFGYAYRMGIAALDRAGAAGSLPYELPANRSFFESAKGLAWCLLRLGKRELAVEVVQRVLACDPSDPLRIQDLLSDAQPG